MKLLRNTPRKVYASNYGGLGYQIFVYRNKLTSRIHVRMEEFDSDEYNKIVNEMKKNYYHVQDVRNVQNILAEEL